MTDDRGGWSLVAEVIRHLREKKGWSTRALSQAAGLSPSYVSKLESGEIEPSLRVFGRLALVLEMNQYEVYVCVMREALFTGSEEIFPHPLATC